MKWDDALYLRISQGKWVRARKIHQVRYPIKGIPYVYKYTIFKTIHLRLWETESFNKNRGGEWRSETVTTAELESTILDVI